MTDGDGGRASGDSDRASGDSDRASGDSDRASGDSDRPTRDRPPVLLDVMCGTLATYLRLCGYDAAYALDRGIEADDRLLAAATDEGRTLLTRDRELAARADAADGTPDAVLLAERDVLDQLRELDAAGLPVALADQPTRCGSCNGPVERVGSGRGDASLARPDYVPDDVGTDRPGWRCTDCGRWFWKGGHWDDVAARLDGL